MKVRITYTDGITRIIEVQDALKLKDFVESDPNIIEAELPVDDELVMKEAAEWN